MKRSLVYRLLVAVAASLLVVGCTQAAPAPPPTQPPAKPAEPTKAAAPAAPTQAPAPPTAVPAPKTSFPEKGKTVSIIVPWAAGGATDLQARAMGPTLEKELGIPVQIVNKSGAASQVGTTDALKAKPDGYTIIMTNLPSTIMTYLLPERQAVYGRKDLQQVANVVLDPEAVIVRADSPFKSLKDVVDAAKAKPEELKNGLTGVGSDSDLAGALFAQAAGLKFSKVYIDGGAATGTALLGGHIDLSTMTIGNVPGHLKSGQLRALALMDKTKSKYLPDVPIMDSLGYKVYYSSSRGFSVPAGTPKEVVEILERAFKKAAEDPKVQELLDNSFLAQRFMGAAEYAAYWDEFEAQTKPLVQLLGLK